jgi:hypothetical protein
MSRLERNRKKLSSIEDVSPRSNKLVIRVYRERIIGRQTFPAALISESNEKNAIAGFYYSNSIRPIGF